MNWEAIGAIGEVLGAVAVVMTLVYLALQVRHSKELLERNEKIAMSQVHQARADARMALHLSQAASDHGGVASRVWGNPDLVDELSDEERYLARNYMSAALVHQDNVLYQLSLGLLDERTAFMVPEVIRINMPVWEKLHVPVTPRVRDLYESLQGDP